MIVGTQSAKCRQRSDLHTHKGKEIQKILGTLLYLVIFIKTTQSGATTHCTARTGVHEVPFVGVLPDRFYRAFLNYQPCKR